MTTNEAMLDVLARLQADPKLHPLTCPKDSKHPLLRGEERNGEVVLVCLSCDYVQTDLPFAALGAFAAGEWGKP